MTSFLHLVSLPSSSALSEPDAVIPHFEAELGVLLELLPPLNLLDALSAPGQLRRGRVLHFVVAAEVSQNGGPHQIFSGEIVDECAPAHVHEPPDVVLVRHQHEGSRLVEGETSQGAAVQVAGYGKGCIDQVQFTLSGLRAI